MLILRSSNLEIRMSLEGQSRRFHDVRDMSGLPESGHGRAIYEYTP
jgi:hypothetical protein